MFGSILNTWTEERDFRCEPLTDMVAVGMVTSHSVRIWMRSSKPGRISVEWWPDESPEQKNATEVLIQDTNERDNTAVAMLPDTKATGLSLTPLHTYRFRAIHSTSGHRIGEGVFQASPESPEQTPEQFSVALMSCHQPFDRRGTLRQSSYEMLLAARRCMRERNTKFVLQVGDQMYADFPEQLSLFRRKYFRKIAPHGEKSIHECSASDVRRIYQYRYRQFWDQSEWRELMAEFPCYPILDDHEIIDNWGSRPVYQTDRWLNLGLGAREAYYDYQASRVLPKTAGQLADAYYYSFVYGNTATYVMDIRSNRTAGKDGQLYSDRQEQDLRNFLDQTRKHSVIFLVLSVPIVHLPRFLARFVSSLPRTGEDFSDRWSSGAHIRDRDKMLRILRNHQRRNPHQKVVLLSGDIHIGCVHVLNWDDTGPALYQMISSPITHQTGLLLQWASKAIIAANRRINADDGPLSASVSPFTGIPNRSKNPYGKLNLGMIEVITPAPGAEPKMKFLLYGNKKGEPVCVYESPEV